MGVPLPAASAELLAFSAKLPAAGCIPLPEVYDTGGLRGRGIPATYHTVPGRDRFASWSPAPGRRLDYWTTGVVGCTAITRRRVSTFTGIILK